MKKSVNKGITLISLVITIVIMLILAGVSFAFILGNNGIMQKTIFSKEMQEKASVKEKIELALNEIDTEYENQRIDNNDLNKLTFINDNFKDILDNFSSNVDVIDEDGVFKQITISNYQYDGKNFTIIIDGNEKVTVYGADDEKPTQEVTGVKWNGNRATSFSKGTGTAEDPYLVQTGDELSFLADTVNTGNNCSGKNYKLTTNLDLNNINWTPIGGNGSNAKYFAGTFDGNNQKILNLKIETTNSFAGLFGCAKSSNIKNVNIYSGNVIGTTYVGGVVGGILNSNMSHCINSAQITGTTNYIGGIAGAATSSGGQSSVEKCINEGIINGQSYVGGIIGITDTDEALGSVTITNNAIFKAHDLYNKGNVTATGNYTGGVIGYAAGYRDYNYMANFINLGNVTGVKLVGGCLGVIRADDGWGGGSGYAYLANSYNAGTVTGSSSVAGGIGDITSSYVSNGCKAGAYNIYSINTVLGTTQVAKPSNYTAGTLETKNMEVKTDDELKSNDFMNLLNSNNSIYASAYGITLSNWIMEDGYPVPNIR